MSNTGAMDIGISTETQSTPLQAIAVQNHQYQPPLPKKKKKRTRGRTSSTRGSRQGSRRNTSKPKSHPSEPNIPVASSSEIVPLGLTSVGKASRRFFNSSLRAVYETSILPTVTDYAASHTICSSEYSENLVQQSVWTHTTMTPPSLFLPKISSLSSPFLAPVSMAAAAAARNEEKKNNQQPENKKRKTEKKIEVLSHDLQQCDEDVDCEDEIEEKVAGGKKKRPPFTRTRPFDGRMRSYKIEMVMPAPQKRAMKVCFAASVKAYNFANSLIIDDKEPVNFGSIRKKWYAGKRPDWSSGVARRFEAGAIKECVTAHMTNIKKRLKNPKHHYHVKYRSFRHSKILSLEVESTGIVNKIEPLQVAGSRAECLLFLGNNMAAHGGIRLRDSKRVIDEVVKQGKNLHAAGRIQWVRNTDSFYFIWAFPRPILIDEDALFENKRIAALDPGLAPFQEWYSPTSGEYGTLLTDAKTSLKAKCLAIDLLRSKVDRRKGHKGRATTHRCQAKSRKKQKYKRRRTTRGLKRKLARDCARLRGHVCHGHYSAANFLLEKHDIVIAPILATRRLTEKAQRCFGSEMARRMYTWSHRLFRQRLAYAAARYPGRHVFECKEPGTSGTCTLCGHWNSDLRLGDKVCCCPSCGVCVDRQLAGARNNFWAAYGMARGVGWDGVGG
jgi:hypothetical protein